MLASNNLLKISPCLPAILATPLGDYLLSPSVPEHYPSIHYPNATNVANPFVFGGKLNNRVNRHFPAYILQIKIVAQFEKSMISSRWISQNQFQTVTQ